MPHFSDADAQDKHFGTRIRRAIVWRSGSQIASQIVSWASTLIVIRLLEPADYGLFAMTAVFMNFMSFMNGYGLVSALVQSPTLDNQRLRQAFGLMLVLNAGLAVAQFALAGYAADYYGQPMVANLLRVQALIYLATPFIALPEVLIGRSLDFKRSAFVNILTAMISAITALAGALSGWGIWTLVVAPLVGFWVKGVGNMVATRFFVIPSFDFRGTGSMIAFGASLLGSQLLIMVQSQTDILIGGRLLSAHDLGLYAEALFLTQIFVARFIPPLNDVAFPAYARMQADKALLARSFCKAVRLILLIACPLYLGMAVVASPLVELLFGRKWLEMAPLVSILAASMPLYALQVLFSPALNAIGLPRLTMRIAAVGATIMPPAFLIGAQFGTTGLACAWAGGIALLTMATIRIAGRAMGLRIADLLHAILPSLCASIPMAALVLALGLTLPAMPVAARLAVLVAMGIAAYGTALAIGYRPLLVELLAMVRGRPIEAASAT
ncbi:lipopolysaccharide biosynthesis protein [Sphingobium cloacae]|uniref:Polysaccharide biosynthesis protein n=1 Tax=Sphingobium cloacae TaxID=120107 RepID=A0A1E1F445_9SPHN|nr:lipopolysaccharide biosynthesis protein [Sphingobium cloacae]BAV65293.1 polysaccharide biosynthesis protein [Sphingobium cloacae]